ncbi:cobalt-precorrin-6A reductase [Mycolicibacterium palauense]|uniref:cobalt-precorrin-6A reductase n=1 Tax=Mycolicibacterium palauense TaxID=2034511 RepID=UPI000BFEF98F|nr:cobalt-precorrin-6A reductase [Mycolicibacterium palauense]
MSGARGRILLLGGTGEARALAARLHPGVEIVSSLAGRVPDPALPAGPVRIGGFGGPEGLARYLRDEAITAVVDATHPYAATITATAARVCAELGLPHLVLARPGWDSAGYLSVPSDRAAAELVAEHRFSRVFLTTGRSGTVAFRDSTAWFLIRAVTEPDPATLPIHHEVLLSRGPYRYADERVLLRDHRIDALVTKNSGGAMTRPKLDAATDLGVAVVMIDRPSLPAGVVSVADVDGALLWLRSLTG